MNILIIDSEKIKFNKLFLLLRDIKWENLDENTIQQFRYNLESNNNDRGSSYLHENSRLSQVFIDWLLDLKLPLISRQVYLIIKAICEGNEEITNKEMILLNKLINPWKDDKIPGKILVNLVIREIMDEGANLETFNEFSNLIINVINAPKFRNIVQNSNPYIIDETEINYLNEHPHQLDVVILHLGLYHDLLEPEKNNIKKILFYMESFSFALETKKLIPIQVFVDRVSELFMDQLNILYLILKSTSSLKELIDIGNQLPAIVTHYASISQIIHDLKLEQLFSEIDDYCESLHNENIIISSAFDRLQAFSSYLVDIHNNIVGIKNDVISIPLRLLHSDNILSNLSIFNTIIPAMVLDERINLSGERGMDLFFQSIPKIFSHYEAYESQGSKFLVKITPLDDDHSFMGCGESLFSRSLINDLKNHLINHNLHDLTGKVPHHRAIIANLLSQHDEAFYEHECDKSPLLLLIPLFDDYLDEPVFFKIPKSKRRYFADYGDFWWMISKYVSGKKNVPKFKAKIPSFRKAQQVFYNIVDIALNPDDKKQFVQILEDLDAKFDNLF